METLAVMMAEIAVSQIEHSPLRYERRGVERSGECGAHYAHYAVWLPFGAVLCDVILSLHSTKAEE